MNKTVKQPDLERRGLLNIILVGLGAIGALFTLPPFIRFLFPRALAKPHRAPVKANINGPAASSRIIWQLQGTQLSAMEREWLRHPASAGIVLYADNYDNPAQLKALTSQIREIAPQAIVSIDHEGGRVQRLKQGFTSMPPPALIGRLYQRDARQGLEMAELSGRLAGAELRKCGITVNYAPVLDINRSLNRAIGDRAWGESYAQVMALAGAYISGLHKSGVVSVGKHFPGHGGVKADSHHQLPVDKRAVKAILEDMQPFVALAPQLPALMTAHIVYENIDSQPATFSRFWLQDWLRAKLNYQGVVFSDELNMGAVKNLHSGIEGGLEQAFSAGCDLALVSGDAEIIRRCFAFWERAQLPPPTSLGLLPEPEDGFDEQAARNRMRDFYAGL